LNSIPNAAGSAQHQHLRWRLACLLRQLPERHRPGLLSISLEASSPLGARLPELRDGDLYWSRAQAAERLFGRGLAFSQHGAGAGRLPELARALQRAAGAWRRLDADGAGEPRLFVAFAFDGADAMRAPWNAFPNAVLWLPELLVHETPQTCRLVFSVRQPIGSTGAVIERWLALLASVQADARRAANADRQPLQRLAAQPAEGDWLRLAAQAMEAIDQRRVDKLVLYRQLRLGLPMPLSGAALSWQMEQIYPDCRIFAARRAAHTFVSASPERLLAKQGATLMTDALAGTARRAADATLDAQLAQTLLDDPKTRLEHQLVANAVRHALQPFCEPLPAPSAPALRRLHTVQHLWSEVRGRLMQPVPLLELADALHPTPAVNGTPRAAALHWLRAHAQAERGWYCGAAGWVDAQGDGELDVLLRCALLGQTGADLFAGAGLVSGSRPTAELAETELKWGAIIAALRP
jgi:isochorismate synthase